MRFNGRQQAAGIAGLGLIAGLGFIGAGWVAFAGVLLGFAVSAVSIAALALVVGLLAATRPEARRGTVTVMLTNVLKFPILLVGLYFGARLPAGGLYCFLATIGLVYCLTVWHLVEKIQRPEPYEKSP